MVLSKINSTPYGRFKPCSNDYHKDIYKRRNMQACMNSRRRDMLTQMSPAFRALCL